MAKQSSKTSILVIVFLLLLLMAVKGFRSCNRDSTDPVKEVKTRVQDTDVNTKSDWRLRRLVYTKHAKCRMSCRNISESEVEAIQKSGTINYHKSDLQDSPCPSYAIEGRTNDGQMVRIVFGACQKVTTVITCIDIDVEHTCECK